jgi:hypothetical protein
MIQKLKPVLLCLAVVLTMSLVPVQTTYAETRSGPCRSYDPNFLSFPTWDRGLQCKHDSEVEGSKHVDVVTSGGIDTFIWTVVLNVLDILLRVAGILAVCLLIANAYQYLTSAGVPDKIAKAKRGMAQTIVGLAIALLSSTIIYYIIGRLAP